MEQYQACIKNNIIVNVIVCDDSFANTVLNKFNYDLIIDITSLDPRPGPNWSYDGSIFSPPVQDS